MDALYYRSTRETSITDEDDLSLVHALSADAFGAHLSRSSSSSIASRAQFSDELDIPNFPSLSMQLLQGIWEPSDDEKVVPRTSGGFS